LHLHWQNANEFFNSNALELVRAVKIFEKSPYFFQLFVGVMNVVGYCFGSWNTTWGQHSRHSPGAKDRELTQQHSWLSHQ